jgi:peroxiredoxin
MRKYLLVISLFAFLASCNNKPGAGNGVTATDSTFVINGNIAGLDTGKIIFGHRAGDEKVYDTVEIKSGAFQYTGKVPASDGINSYSCMLPGKGEDRVDILVQNANLQFTAKADSFAAASVKGSPAQDDLNVFSQQTKDVDAAMSALGKLYTETKDKAVKDSLNKVYDQYDSVIQSYVPGFVSAHPHSYASAYIISRTLLINPKVEVLERVYNSLDSIVKVSKFGKVVVDVLGAAHKTAVGQVAPDFTMNDRDGKPVALSSLRGKYIFLDFWASWCGPCRRENPNIVEAYAKFHSAKFDILGVSLDSEKDNWEMAIEKDKLTWQHVSDLKGWGNAAAKMYGIRAIPANLLLDKEGKILARNLYGSDLEKKLKEVLK